MKQLANRYSPFAALILLLLLFACDNPSTPAPTAVTSGGTPAPSTAAPPSLGTGTPYATVDPASPEGHFKNGSDAYTLGEYDKAIAEYTQVLTMKPDFLAAYVNRGSAYIELGNYDKAIADFDAAIKVQPDMSAAYFGRGLAY